MDSAEGDFVCIASFDDPGGLALAKSVLSAGGIRVVTRGEEAAALYTRVLSADLYVPSEQAEEARRLLEGIDPGPEE